MGESQVIAAGAALSAFSVQRSAVHLNTTDSCGSIFRSMSGAQVVLTGGHFEHHALNNAQIN